MFLHPTLARGGLMLKAAAPGSLLGEVIAGPHLNSVFLPFLQQVEIHQHDWCKHFVQVFLGSPWGLCSIHANLGFGGLSWVTQFALSSKSNHFTWSASSKVEPWKVSGASLCWDEELQFPLHNKCLLCLGVPFLFPSPQRFVVGNQHFWKLQSGGRADGNLLSAQCLFYVFS